MAHYFPYDVKLGLLADSRSFLANQKARNAIVGAENLLNLNNLPHPLLKRSSKKHIFLYLFIDKVVWLATAVIRFVTQHLKHCMMTLIMASKETMFVMWCNLKNYTLKKWYVQVPGRNSSNTGLTGYPLYLGLPTTSPPLSHYVSGGVITALAQELV